MKNILILLIMLIAPFVFSQTEIETIELDSLSVKDYEVMSFKGATIDTYILRTEYALKKMESPDKKDKFKAEVLLAVISNHLGNAIKDCNLNPNEKKTKELLSVFEKHDYLIYQPKIHNAVKLAHYACEGSYMYIYERATTVPLFYSALILLILILLFSIANLFGLINWKYKRLYNKLVVIAFTLIVLMITAFKLTCNENIEENSVYGIIIELNPCNSSNE